MGRLFFILSTALCLTACASISQEQCVAGNWQELGYKDGSNGANIDRVSKYADICTEHGVTLDTGLYSEGYTQGIETYCTDTRGYRAGEGGSSFNESCFGFTGYEQAYSEGRVVFEIESEYAHLLDEYDGLLKDYIAIEKTLKVDETLSDKDRKKLYLKQDRIKRELRGLRYDIRDFENVHGFPRIRLEGV